MEADSSQDSQSAPGQQRSSGRAQAAGQPRETEFTVYIRGQRYNKLELIGRGGSSKVYKVTSVSIYVSNPSLVYTTNYVHIYIE